MWGVGGHNDYFVLTPKERLSLTLQKFNEKRWRPLTVFPLQISDNVSISESGAGIVASSQRRGALNVTEVSNFYGYFK